MHSSNLFHTPRHVRLLLAATGVTPYPRALQIKELKKELEALRAPYNNHSPQMESAGVQALEDGFECRPGLFQGGPLSSCLFAWSTPFGAVACHHPTMVAQASDHCHTNDRGLLLAHHTFCVD